MYPSLLPSTWHSGCVSLRNNTFLAVKFVKFAICIITTMERRDGKLVENERP